MLTRTKNDWEKAGIAQFTYGIRSELSMQRRAEQLRQRKKRRENRARFVKKNLLSSQRSFIVKKDQGHFPVERKKSRVIYKKHIPTH